MPEKLKKKFLVETSLWYIVWKESLTKNYKRILDRMKEKMVERLKEVQGKGGIS